MDTLKERRDLLRCFALLERAVCIHGAKEIGGVAQGREFGREDRCKDAISRSKCAMTFDLPMMLSAVNLSSSQKL